MIPNILTTKARELFPKLSSFKDSFYLAGGTGLALQIGHRISVDFDLFSESPIKKTLIKKVEEVFEKESQEILVNNSRELTLIIGGVKCTFLHYPFDIILPLVTSGPIPLLSVREILAGKAYTIGRRGELKDYIDLYIGLRDSHSSLGEIINLANKKFRSAFNDRLFLEQLVYLDDIDSVDVIMVSGQIPTKAQLTDYFSTLIHKSGLI
jgi:predicted nucleotidyltransferase component of viral defense system